MLFFVGRTNFRGGAHDDDDDGARGRSHAKHALALDNIAMPLYASPCLCRMPTGLPIPLSHTHTCVRENPEWPHYVCAAAAVLRAYLCRAYRTRHMMKIDNTLNTLNI